MQMLFSPSLQLRSFYHYHTASTTSLNQKKRNLAWSILYVITLFGTLLLLYYNALWNTANEHMATEWVCQLMARSSLLIGLSTAGHGLLSKSGLSAWATIFIRSPRRATSLVTSGPTPQNKWANSSKQDLLKTAYLNLPGLLLSLPTSYYVYLSETLSALQYFSYASLLRSYCHRGFPRLLFQSTALYPIPRHYILS